MQTSQTQTIHTNMGQFERYASIVVGVILLLTFLRRSLFSIVIGLTGAYLLQRGMSGYDFLYSVLGIKREGEGSPQSVIVRRSTTVNKPVEEVYNFWRDFENLPRFMQHLKAVAVNNGRSHWVAKAPLDRTVEWDAEITDERENELIAWRSVEGADIRNKGEVHFRPAPDNQGTEVDVTLQYDPPGGSLGAAVAKLLGEEPDVQVREDLRRFKEFMETGEMPTTEGQPRGAQEAPGI
jgi:uncharacterized membrane protein